MMTRVYVFLLLLTVLLEVRLTFCADDSSVDNNKEEDTKQNIVDIQAHMRKVLEAMRSTSSPPPGEEFPPSDDQSTTGFPDPNSNNNNNLPDDFEGLTPFVYPITSMNTFDSIIATHQILIIVFHSVGCGHCVQLIPMLEETAQVLRNVEYVLLASVNITAQPQLAARLMCTAVPTIRMYKHWQETDSVFIEPYAETKHIVNAVQKHLTSYCRFIPHGDVNNIMHFLRGNTKLFVVYCPAHIKDCRKLVPQLNEVSRELVGEDAGIVFVTDKDWAAQFWIHGDAAQLSDTTAPHISFVEYGRPKYTYEGELNALEMMYVMVHELTLSSSPEDNGVVSRLESLAQLEAKVEEHSVVVVGLFQTVTGQEMLLKLFEVFAFENRKICAFAVAINCSDIMLYSEAKNFPSIIMFKTFEERKRVLDGAANT